jgi:hypothetical protein
VLTPGGSTHLHTNNTQNTQKAHNNKKLKIHNHKKLTNLGGAGRAPSLRVIPWHLPYNRGKKTEKPHLG